MWLAFKFGTLDLRANRVSRFARVDARVAAHLTKIAQFTNLTKDQTLRLI
ncbi:hypothetical protein GCM10023333_35040 [Ferrimonas pelagia]|uniref:Uncharacterized protein n=1 Tax=Ferrimonas pelagia TaxID=1177826 RepID=A0ABP9FBI3_9GAMM